MAKFKQECIFGIRAVMEAIQDEKEIDKVMFRQGIKGDLFQQLFSLVRERQIQFQYVPEEVFKPFAGKNHQGVLAEVSPIPYQDIKYGRGCCGGGRENTINTYFGSDY